MGTHNCVSNSAIQHYWGKSDVLNFNESNPVRPSRGSAGRVRAGRKCLGASYLCTHFASVETTVITSMSSTLQDIHSSHSKSDDSLPLCPRHSSPTPAWLTPLSPQVSPLPRSSFLGHCLSPPKELYECRDQTV